MKKITPLLSLSRHSIPAFNPPSLAAASLRLTCAIILQELLSIAREKCEFDLARGGSAVLPIFQLNKLKINPASLSRHSVPAQQHRRPPPSQSLPFPRVTAVRRTVASAVSRPPQPTPTAIITRSHFPSRPQPYPGLCLPLSVSSGCRLGCSSLPSAGHSPSAKPCCSSKHSRGRSQTQRALPVGHVQTGSPRGFLPVASPFFSR